MTTALALYAGIGFGVACRRLGLDEVGVENEPDVIRTRQAAGMVTLWHDVWQGAGEHTPLTYELLTAGPPCQTFSTVGRGHGRPHLELLTELAVAIGNGMTAAELRERTSHIEDPRTALVLLPLIYAIRDLPRAIVLEQVPAVLPVWEVYAMVLRSWGYSAETGIVNSEQYGVPQTRKRAVLVARRDGVEAHLPAPTHSKYHTRSPHRTDSGVLPWVSMADAMGWPESVVGFPREADGRDDGIEIGDRLYRSRDLRPTDRPAWAITGKARSWRRWGFTQRPATTVTGHGFATRHPTGVQRAHLNAIEAGTFELREPFTMDTAKLPTFDNVSLSRSYHGDSVNITLEEGRVLQTFDPDFPLVGTKTRQWQTLGNAVPVRLAEHLIRAVL